LLFFSVENLGGEKLHQGLGGASRGVANLQETADCRLKARLELHSSANQPVDKKEHEGRRLLTLRVVWQSSIFCWRAPNLIYSIFACLFAANEREGDSMRRQNLRGETAMGLIGSTTNYHRGQKFNFSKKNNKRKSSPTCSIRSLPAI